MTKTKVLLGCLPQMVEAIKTALERNGYEVVLARKGSEVEAAAKSDNCPQAYIIDADLPTWWNSGQNAMGLVKRIYRVPVVYLKKVGSFPSIMERRMEEEAVVIYQNLSSLEQNEIAQILSALSDLLEQHNRTISHFDWE